MATSPTVVPDHIVILEYDPDWPVLFAREAARIRAALGDVAVRLEHAGSTAVPGLAAKPVVDIVVAVADSADEPTYMRPLVSAGYELRVREPDWYEHRMFSRPDNTVNLHVFSSDCPEVERMLLLRNWLRADRADRELYSQTKRSLAAESWPSVQHYADAKTAVIEEIIGRARKELTP